MAEVYDFVQGTTPLVVSVPHAGTTVPDAIRARLSEAATALPDTDWHVDRLYEFAGDLGATVLTARYSRYVVDLNRDPDGRPLYPGADNTETCPTGTFDNAPIYRPGEAPDEGEVAERVATYWRPYHARLGEALEDTRSRHGHAVLFDAHSIRSVVPRFFDGRLPDLNFGTARGQSADHGLAASAYRVLESAAGYSAVRDGRFTGGYITRRHGRPAEGVHALQLEMAQAVYMEERPPYRYRPDRADRIRPHLHALLALLAGWRPPAA